MAPQILQGKNCTLISLVGCEIVEDGPALSAVTGDCKACRLELLVLIVACWVVVWFGVENCEVEIRCFCSGAIVKSTVKGFKCRLLCFW